MRRAEKIINKFMDEKSEQYVFLQSKYAKAVTDALARARKKKESKDEEGGGHAHSHALHAHLFADVNKLLLDKMQDAFKQFKERGEIRRMMRAYPLAQEVWPFFFKAPHCVFCVRSLRPRFHR